MPTRLEIGLLLYGLGIMFGQGSFGEAAPKSWRFLFVGISFGLGVWLIGGCFKD